VLRSPRWRPLMVASRGSTRLSRFFFSGADWGTDEPRVRPGLAPSSRRVREVRVRRVPSRSVALVPRRLRSDAHRRHAPRVALRVLLSAPDRARGSPALAAELAMFKTCSCCGRAFDRIGWLALALVGVHREGGGYPDLEMRNCACGSTLSVELTVPCERVKI
jgi:hypothetical protein